MVLAAVLWRIVPSSVISAGSLRRIRGKRLDMVFAVMIYENSRQPS
jgi:hypothetical protein